MNAGANSEDASPGNASIQCFTGGEPQRGTPGKTSPQARREPRGWYTRGYLPHCDSPELLQAITYRLADSLPADAIERMEAELRECSPARQDAERRRQLDAWLDAGHGCCVLRQTLAAQCVVDTWRRFDGERYDLLAWVVMPNHVHVMIRVYDGQPLGRIVQSWKSYTGRRIAPLIAGAPADQQGALRVWMREYWDRYIRDEHHFEMVLRYIHENPVRAGLTQDALAWPWSSAVQYSEASEH